MVSSAKRAISLKSFLRFSGCGMHSKQSVKANIKTSNIAISGINAAQIHSPSVKELDPCTITNYIDIAYKTEPLKQ